MKFNIYKSVAMCSLLALAGCHDFEELNTDPYAPIYDPTVANVSPDGIDIDYELSESALKSIKGMEGAIGVTLANFLYEGAYNDYQTTTNLTHDIYAGYWGNNVSGFVTSSPTYSYADGWSGGRWKHFYDDRTIGEYAQIIKTCHFCDPEYYHTLYYVTRIYYAYLLSMQTDTYGDIPIKYYVKGAMPPEENVEYTSQESVYKDFIFPILDQAITALHEENIPGSQYTIKSEDDKCFGGDIDKWRRFANTLRLRLALRVSNADPELAKEQAKLALGDIAGLMKSNDDNLKQTPKRQYLAGGNENIYALLFGWGANVVLTKEMEWAYKNQSFEGGVVPADQSEWEVKDPAKDATTKFNNDETQCILDPRCEILWFRPTEFDKLNIATPEESNKDFAGVRNGEPNLGKSYTTSYSPNRCSTTSDVMNPQIWWNYAREIVWMGYAESLFLKAEAYLRWPELNREGTASVKDLYEAGVRASMDYYGIDASKANNYINGLVALHDWKADREWQLEQIITQKWIAVFPNGNEGWAELRRTDYPRYALLPKGGNNSGNQVDNNKLIKRISYPDSEARNTLKPNYTQGDRVWWDVDDTMDNNGKWETPHNFR